MRTSLLLLFLVVPFGCGASSDMQLPRLGTVGDPPPAAETVEITVLADGTARFEGHEVSAAALLELLERRTRDHPRDDRFTDRGSLLNVLLRCDARASVSALRPVLIACADPAVRISRLFYAVEHEAGGEGAFAWFLPHLTCICGGHTGDAPRVAPTIRVDLTAAGPEEADALHAALRALPDEARACPVICADAKLPIGDLLRSVDLCHRAGAVAVVLFRRFRRQGTLGGIGLDVEPIPAAEPRGQGPRPVPRISGPAGLHHDFRVIVEELLSPDDPEEGDRMHLPVEESLGD